MWGGGGGGGECVGGDETSVCAYHITLHNDYQLVCLIHHQDQLLYKRCHTTQTNSFMELPPVCVCV